MWLASTLVWLSLLVAIPAPAFARCDPTTEPDKSDVANARAAVAANCDCADATSRGEYVRCATQQAEAALLNRGCRGRVKKCASKSTCGKPGSVTCCRTNNGESKCRTMRSAASCEAKGGTVGTCTSCCDACPAPGTGPTCPGTTTTTPTTGNQCCLKETACGGYDLCRLMTPAECAAVGISIGPGDCVHVGCAAVTTTLVPILACCAGDQCTVKNACQCGVDGGQVVFLEDCTPHACCTGDGCVESSPCDCLTAGGQPVRAATCSPDPCMTATP
jgi:hypothetical protein